MTTPPVLSKGMRMEESLRDYFLEMGYYVIRGANFKHEDCDITDIDLWLYQRTSSFSRERFNVDIKNKKTPQALERVLWAKGLQYCLRLDGALVATTDTRNSVKSFGELHGVIILDGTLLTKIQHRYSTAAKRLSEEEWNGLVRTDKNDRLGQAWTERIASAKSRILTQVNFDGANAHLNDIGYFADQLFVSPPRKTEIACRQFYLTVSMALVTLDYIICGFAFIDRTLQAKQLNEGLRFGTVGERGADKVFSAAAKIAAAYTGNHSVRPSDLVKYFQSESSQLPVEILSEHLLRHSQSGGLFAIARAFEGLAFARQFNSPPALNVEQRAMIGALLDFHKIERKRFFEVFSVSTNTQIQSELPIVPPTTSSPTPDQAGSDAARA